MSIPDPGTSSQDWHKQHWEDNTARLLAIFGPDDPLSDYISISIALGSVSPIDLETRQVFFQLEDGPKVPFGTVAELAELKQLGGSTALERRAKTLALRFQQLMAVFPMTHVVIIISFSDATEVIPFASYEDALNYIRQRSTLWDYLELTDEERAVAPLAVFTEAYNDGSQESIDIVAFPHQCDGDWIAQDQKGSPQ